MPGLAGEGGWGGGGGDDGARRKLSFTTFSRLPFSSASPPPPPPSQPSFIHFSTIPNSLSQFKLCTSSPAPSPLNPSILSLFTLLSIHQPKASLLSDSFSPCSHPSPNPFSWFIEPPLLTSSQQIEFPLNPSSPPGRCSLQTPHLLRRLSPLQTPQLLPTD